MEVRTYSTSVAALALVLMFAGGCGRSPDGPQTEAAKDACGREVQAWVDKQHGFGAKFAASAAYDADKDRCFAHIKGGAAPGSRFESLVDVRRDHVVAGCSDAREALGDTPCEVEGKPVSGSAGRLTIDRLTGH
jgi:hypothetical protein